MEIYEHDLQTTEALYKLFARLETLLWHLQGGSPLQLIFYWTSRFLSMI
jgi:hypothetical protein